MLNLLSTSFVLVNTLFLLILILFLYKFKRSIPDIQQVLDDVGESIGEQLSGIFEKPMVSRAMSVMGKESGKVRGNKALMNKVATKAIGQNVLAKKALEYLDITPMEGLQLLNDPTFGPMIQGLIGQFSKGAAGGFGGFKPPNNGQQGLAGYNYPREQ